VRQLQDDVKSRKMLNRSRTNGIQSRFETKSSGLCGKWRGITKAAACLEVGRAKYTDGREGRTSLATR
jgi:hypothetical protein